jgi:hypothetical protein
MPPGTVKFGFGVSSFPNPRPGLEVLLPTRGQRHPSRHTLELMTLANQVNAKTAGFTRNTLVNHFCETH